jgi:hypothetical protein
MNGRGCSARLPETFVDRVGNSARPHFSHAQHALVRQRSIYKTDLRPAGPAHVGGSPEVPSQYRSRSLGRLAAEDRRLLRRVAATK